MCLYKISSFSLLLLLFSTAASGKIVFSSIREEVHGIYVMDDDGSNQIVLTKSKELRPYPSSWSPNGELIVFKRLVEKNGEYAIFLMNSDGTNIRQLTRGDWDSTGRVSFSPDSKSIVFNRIVRINNKEKYSITVLNIETGKMTDIADINVNFCDWSPDGKQIIYSMPLEVGGGGNTIWIMRADGHHPRRLIPEPPDGQFVIHRWRQRWSPDGDQIVFTEREYAWVLIPNVGIELIRKAYRYIVCDKNGKNIKKLNIPKEWAPISIDWMDNGNSVVFSAYTEIPLNEPIPRGFVFPPVNIYKYHIRTEKITQLTDHPGRDQTVDWISDDVLSVTPLDKKKVMWGALKK